MHAHALDTRDPWAPIMLFRPAHSRRRLPRTLCEHFVDEQVLSFLRTHLPLGGPGYDYDAAVQRALKFVTCIVLGP